jgi:hypothetical protein
MGLQDAVTTRPESRSCAAASPGSISKKRCGEFGLKYGPAVCCGVTSWPGGHGSATAYKLSPNLRRNERAVLYLFRL